MAFLLANPALPEATRRPKCRPQHRHGSGNHGCRSHDEAGMTLFSRYSMFALVALFAVGHAVPAPAQSAKAEPSAVGLWEQVDDASGKPEGWFRIIEKNGVYEGVLVK